MTRKLTQLVVSNFKRFERVDIPLDDVIVFIGPNNSGKTTALQALALWDYGIRHWIDRRGSQSTQTPEKRPGVTMNRRDLLAIPVPDANLLWRGLHVRNVQNLIDPITGARKPKTDNIRIEVTVRGIGPADPSTSQPEPWECGLEFDYANQESLYCRPLRKPNGEKWERMNIPPQARKIRVAYLPPMSGLAAVEPKWETGRINVLIGEGQTAQVLRNMCHQLAENNKSDWELLVSHIHQLFGVTLDAPRYLAERGEITAAYTDRDGTKLDLSCSGRGLQQTLLVLAHLYANPGTILLLDEPDAHLEILRQREIYHLLSEITRKQGSQVLIASHSEVVLNEAAQRDAVVAFVGKPHRIDTSKEVEKALREIGFEHYYLAEEKGWVLYVEGSSDLAILRAFARTLEHKAYTLLAERPFVKTLGNNIPGDARRHFHGLREAKRDLVGVAIFDRIDKPLETGPFLCETMWSKREIENYLCDREILIRYARRLTHEPSENGEWISRGLFANIYEEAMRSAIDEIESALKTLGKSPWSPDIKASDEFFDPLFRNFHSRLNIPLELRKSEYHMIAAEAPKELIDPEVVAKLDLIASVAEQAKRPSN